MIALRQVSAYLWVGVVEQPFIRLSRCVARSNRHSRAYRGIQVLGKHHPEGVREAAVEGERVREPVVVSGNDLGDHVIAQVRPLGHLAKALAIAEEASHEFGWQGGDSREPVHHLGEVHRLRYGVRHGKRPSASVIRPPSLSLAIGERAITKGTGAITLTECGFKTLQGAFGAEAALDNRKGEV
ncbi:hypothetical protein [Streptomyces sp. NPDC002209]|uniref:hypothetical protein n=1 Tax=Streptomyces sp. NPDC002209 TaxID=3364638 RepID=UPI003681B023